MQDSENKNPETSESMEQSPEPSQVEQPVYGFQEVNATYEMLVRAKKAIRRNKWDGGDVEAMAMLVTMLARMEGQYRTQLDRMKAEEKQFKKRAQEEIQKAGGQVNANPFPTVA